ncbi:SUKH-4 family immunity protein, partial [Streptomyces sp. 4N124]
MVTFAQAQERAEEWINGDVPSYQHREVRVREFELGFVVWPEDRADGPRSDGGTQRLVIARDSGEATLWPSLPVGEVIRRYEEEYGGPDGAAEPAPAPAAPARVDLNQTSFLLTPPEWLQEAADQLGIADRRGATAGASGSGSSAGADQAPAAAAAGGASDGAGAGVGASETGGGAGVRAGAPSGPGVPAGATPWAGTDTNADAGDDRSVPLPETVFAPPLSGADDETSPPAAPDAKTALMSGGSQLPPTAQEPAIDAPGAPGGSMPPPAPSYGYPQGPGGAGAPGAPSYGYPQGPGGADAGTSSPGAPGRPLAPNAEDIADAATSKAGPPRAARGGAVPPPPPPGAPGAPGARAGGPPPPPPPGPGAPGTPAGGYVPTQLVSALGPDGSEGPGGTGGGPQTPGAPGGTPPGGVHHAATVLSDPGRMGPGSPGAPQPPGAPGMPGAQGSSGGQGAVHHAETVLS